MPTVEAFAAQVGAQKNRTLSSVQVKAGLSFGRLIRLMRKI